MPLHLPGERFPIEIFETIIDVLADQYNPLPSIRACSLVCHDFLPITRKHLFATLELDLKQSGTLDRLVSLISRTPIIAKYVHTLDICIFLRDPPVERLPEILKEFTMLKSLTIYIYPEDHNDTWSWSWNKIPLPLKDALLYLFHLPTLSHLTLGPLNDFAIPDLAFHSNLKYLNLRNVRIAPVHPDAEEHAWPFQNHIDEVDDLSTNRNADGTLVIDLSNHDVKEFQLDIGLSDKTKALFARCSQLMDIRTYKFNYGQGLMLIKGFADTVLPALQTLQHLYIYITVTEEDNHVLGGLPAEFDFIAGKNVIESISIFVIILFGRDYRIGDEWGELDRALTQLRSGWPNLKDVTVNIEISSYLKGARELEVALRQLPEAHLKGLARSKDIKLNFEVTYDYEGTESNSITDFESDSETWTSIYVF